jgi:hypothetical protein
MEAMEAAYIILDFYGSHTEKGKKKWMMLILIYFIQLNMSEPLLVCNQYKITTDT